MPLPELALIYFTAASRRFRQGLRAHVPVFHDRREAGPRVWVCQLGGKESELEKAVGEMAARLAQGPTVAFTIAREYLHRAMGTFLRQQFKFESTGDAVRRSRIHKEG